MNKIITIGVALFMLVLNGCSLVGIGVSSDVNKHLEKQEWVAVNNNKVKAYNEKK